MRLRIGVRQAQQRSGVGMTGARQPGREPAAAGRTELDPPASDLYGGDMASWLRRQAIAVLVLLGFIAAITLAWIWVMAPHAPGILRAIGAAP